MLTISLCVPAVAQVITTQPDYYNEPFKKSLAFYRNVGQKVNNLGQVENEIRYLSYNGTPEVCLKSKSTISVWWTDFSPVSNPPTITSVNRIDLHPVGSHSSSVEPTPQTQSPDLINVYSEVAPHAFENIRGYYQVIYPQIYPNINMVAYSGPAGPKLSFVCEPGSDPNDINIQFTGQDSLKLDLTGELKAFLNQKWIKYKQAIAYQYDNNNNIIPIAWTANYIVDNNQGIVSLHFEAYDTTKPLVFQIGETLDAAASNDGVIWSTNYSGNGVDQFYAVDHDPAGNIYAGGYANEGNFPVTLGTSINPGSYTGTLAKFDANHQRLWATYYGGSQADEVKSLCYSSSNSSLYATGYTYSGDFPLVQATGATNDSAGTNYILRINSTNGTATWSTKLGQGRGLSLVCRTDGSKYLVGTAPNNGVNIVPHSGSYHQPYGGGNFDGIVFKFNSNDLLVWSSYFGGSGDDEYIEDVCTDELGNLYMLGMTSSNTIPAAYPGGNAYQQHNNAGGGTDLMIAKLNSSDSLVYSSLYGGNGTDISPDHDCIQVGNGRVYIGAYTNSNNFPYTTHTGSVNDTTYAGGNDGVIIVMNTATMAVDYATYVGGSGFDGFYGVAVDTHGNAYFVGTTTTDTGLPTVNSNGLYYDDSYNGGGNFSGQPGDGLILRLDGNTLNTSWLTYFGGTGPDALWGVDAFSDQRIAVVGFSSGGAIDYPLYDPGNAWFQAAMATASVVAELLTPDGPIGISEVSNQSFSISPNPAHDIVRITASGIHSGIRSVSMFDVTGRSCPIQLGVQNRTVFSVTNIQAGYYVVQVEFIDGTYSSAKLLITHD